MNWIACFLPSSHAGLSDTGEAKEVLDIEPIRAIPVLEDPWPSGALNPTSYIAAPPERYQVDPRPALAHRAFEFSYELGGVTKTTRVPASKQAQFEASEHARRMEGFADLIDTLPESSLKPMPMFNSAVDPALDWPWAPDWDTMMHAPKKKYKTLPSRQALEDKWLQAKPPLRPEESHEVGEWMNRRQRSYSSDTQEKEAQWNARAQKVLEQAKQVQVDMANSPPQYLKEEDKDMTEFQDWCEDKMGLHYISFYRDWSKDKKMEHQHKSKVFAPTMVEPIRRAVVSDSRPKMTDPDYGEYLDAPKVWHRHLPTKPRKGMLEDEDAFKDNKGPVPKMNL